MPKIKEENFILSKLGKNKKAYINKKENENETEERIKKLEIDLMECNEKLNNESMELEKLKKKMKEIEKEKSLKENMIQIIKLEIANIKIEKNYLENEMNEEKDNFF